MNLDDEKRDLILRFLYERHKSSRGIQKIPIGIKDLQSEMKKRHSMSQADVSSNLDYLIQVGWVKEDVKERSFKTPRGMELSREQLKYKISDVGINHLQAGTIFSKPQSAGHINITNIRGVTVLGDGNIVNTQYTDLSRALDQLDEAIAKAAGLSDEQKLDAAGDLATIRTQIGKMNPDRGVVGAAWRSLQGVATIEGLAGALQRVGALLGGILDSGAIG